MRHAKKAFLASVLSVVLCVTMLVGTTYAWFTDSVTSAGNKIIAGNLDVEMAWAEGTADPADTTGWADASTGAIFEYDLWEPGYVQVRHVSIKNVGSLALKYKVRIVFNNETLATNANGHTLADAIDVYYLDPAVQFENRAAFEAYITANAVPAVSLQAMLANVNGNASTAEGVLYPAGTTGQAQDTLTIALKMREDAGNEYQGMSLGGSFSVQLLATQYTYEEDSFDNQYDALADETPDNIGWPGDVSSATTDDGTESVTFVASGMLQETTVPAAVVGPIFGELASDEAGASNELTMTMNVKKTSEETTSTTDTNTTVIGLDIDMTAIMKSTVGTSVTTNTKEVVELGSYMDIPIEVGTGLTITAVTHKGHAMVNSANTADDAGYGIYQYDSTTGILTLTVNSLSPFEYTYVTQNAELVITKEGEATIYTTLAAFRDAVNGGNEFEGYKASLKRDVDLSTENWTPIALKGKNLPFFKGEFDGENHTITLNYEGSDPTQDSDKYIALFGQTKGAVIGNLTMRGQFSKVSDSASTVGQMNGGRVYNVKNYLSVSSEEITVNTVDGLAARGKAAGIVVLAQGAIIGNEEQTAVIEECVNYANISTNAEGNNSAGGILALANLGVSIIGCSNYGAVAHNGLKSGNAGSGGILGWATQSDNGTNLNTVLIDSCTNEGSITALNEQIPHGPIYGGTAIQLNWANHLIVRNCTPNTQERE